MQKFLIAFVVLLATGFAGTAADDPTKPSPELLVLEDMIGIWDEVMMNKATEWTPKAEKSTTITKRTWSLGGMFIRGEGSWQPAKTDFLHLMSYDPLVKVYRTWYFDASGNMPRVEMIGTWDAKSKTLTHTGTDKAGNKTISTTTIVDKDHTRWTMIVTDPDGKVVLDFTGKCTRRKE